MKLNSRFFCFTAFLILSGFSSSCTSSRLYEFKARQADEAGNYPAALTNYTSAIELGDPATDPVVSELYLSRAADKYELEDFRGAVSDYNDFLRFHPRFDKGFFKAQAVRVYFAKGNLEHAAGDFHDAISDYDKVIHWRPRYTDAYYERASARWKLNDLAGAAADYDAGLTNHAVDAEAYVKRAQAKGFHGDYAGADGDCTTAIKLDPKNPDPRLSKGFFELAGKKYDLAVADFSSVIAINPLAASAYQDRASAELRLDRPNEALADYTKLISLPNVHGLDHAFLAKALTAAGNRSGAISNLDLAVAWSPRSGFVRRECGWLWDRLGDLDMARTNFDKAIQLEPANASGYVGLGILDSQMSQTHAALENFRKVQQLNPSWIYSWYHVYLIRCRLGEKEAALQELREHMNSLSGATTNDWSVKVGEYLAGKLSEEDLSRLAKASALNPAVEREQFCEADFYCGMQHLLAGDKNTAISLFRACLATREVDFLEYMCAETELSSLSGR